jgi:hypothetical protein
MPPPHQSFYIAISLHPGQGRPAKQGQQERSDFSLSLFSLLASATKKTDGRCPTNTLTTQVGLNELASEESWHRLGPLGAPELKDQCHVHTETPQAAQREGRSSIEPAWHTPLLHFPQQFSASACWGKVEGCELP